VRPDARPPSTFQIAPVTQLASGDRRKVMVDATSRAVPIRPIGCRPSKPCKVCWTLSFGMNFDNVATVS
jgi:hypothetical protein